MDEVRLYNWYDSLWLQVYAEAREIIRSHRPGKLAEFEDAFRRIWNGEAESDSFNRLLLGSRLSWREIALLRAAAAAERTRDGLAEGNARPRHVHHAYERRRGDRARTKRDA